MYECMYVWGWFLGMGVWGRGDTIGGGLPAAGRDDIYVYYIYIYVYVYMSSGQNYLLNLMPCTHWGRPLSV